MTVKIPGLRLALLAGALALPGCAIFRELGVGGDDPKWQERVYKGVNAADVLNLSRTVLEEHHYAIHREDPYRGQLETAWVYGYYDDLTHKSKRERVLIETHEEPDDHLRVKLRVQAQLNTDPGRQLARDEKDWGPADDDVERSKIVITDLHIVLQRIAEPEPKPAAPAAPEDARIKG